MSTSDKKNKPEYNYSVKLTKTLMNQYRESLITRGCEKQTINIYFCYLNRLYAFLPKDKKITNENIKRWISLLREKGYSDRTINMHISSVNGLLRFCGHKNASVSINSVPRKAERPELTREEYLTLLAYVKKYESERNYLLIKTIATIDINITELPLMTVEACQKGVIEFSDHRQALIPDSLKEELLAYINKKAISGGSVFVTNWGNQLDRSNITHMIEQYGQSAGLDPKKCNPRALHSLYERTQEEIKQHLLNYQMSAYEKLLKEEQKKVS